VMRDRLTNVPWLGDTVAREIMRTPGMYSAIPTGLDTIVVTSEFTLPYVRSVGIARLYVDGFPGIGTLTYVPLDDNIGMDGQLVVGGGYKGRAIHGEVSRFRIWSLPLTASQIQQLRGCSLPSLPSLVGGGWPFGLRAAYILNGTYEDTAGTGFQALEKVSEGQFIVGGLCSTERCPEKSSDGCLHVSGRELFFDSIENCESFARYVHCTVAGGNRERPASLTGCGVPAA